MNFIDFIDILLFIVLYLLFLACFFHFKNERTLRNRAIITNAIFWHQKAELDDIFKRFLNGEIEEYQYEPAVDYDDMELYDSTLFRFWDWGLTRILPKEKFEIIKPYIKEIEK